MRGSGRSLCPRAPQTYLTSACFSHALLCVFLPGQRSGDSRLIFQTLHPCSPTGPPHVTRRIRRRSSNSTNAPLKRLQQLNCCQVKSRRLSYPPHDIIPRLRFYHSHLRCLSSSPTSPRFPRLPPSDAQRPGQFPELIL